MNQPTDPLAVYDFTGQVVLVTGGTRGIGRAVALAFARYGATVMACYHSDATAASQLHHHAVALPGTIRTVQVDVGSSAAVSQLVDSTIDDHGAIDILVNNAGWFPRNAVTAISDEEWAAVLQTNLTGAFYCARAVLPTMIANKHGVIINMASIAGQRGSAYHAHYAAAKGGLLAFSRSLAREVSQHGIRVNAIAPGRIETEMLMTQAAHGEYERWVSETPLRRLGHADEIAAAVLFLASPAGAYVIGETLAVNGGIFME
ncbi:MAG: SDR family NAD(P)-dependent oxidoreductase [Caldilineaceae bacterium]